MSADSLSPVALLCLAILHGGESTGYEIKKASVEGDYSYFIDASYGAIYPALVRLAADGRVTVREDVRPGRPARKIYAITAAGRNALVSALCEPPGPDVFRSRFLLLAKFAASMPAQVLRDALRARRAELEAELALLERIEAETAHDPAAQWITGYGRACVAASLDYLNHHADNLVALTIPSAGQVRTNIAVRQTLADAAE